MNYLAISTASKSTLISLSFNGAVHTRELSFSKHSENLFPLLNEMLDSLDLTIGDFDCFGCVVGPGSFTGIRIGLSVIKGFAFALEKPIVAMNSLEILANSGGCEWGKILSVINAGAGLVYHQAFMREAGEVVALSTPRLDTIEHFYGYKNSEFGEGVTIIYSQNGEKPLGYESFNESVDLGVNGLTACMENKIKNKIFTDATRISPIYLRVSQAESALKNLAITRLNAVDLQAVVGLESTHDDYDLDWGTDSLIESLTNPDYICLGMLNGNDLVGMVIAHNVAGDIEILRVKISKSARNMGLATRLIEELKRLASEMGANRILLEVNEHNYPAKSLYLKLGFIEKGRRPRYYENRDDALLLDFLI